MRLLGVLERYVTQHRGQTIGELLGIVGLGERWQQQADLPVAPTNHERWDDDRLGLDCESSDTARDANTMPSQQRLGPASRIPRHPHDVATAEQFPKHHVGPRLTDPAAAGLFDPTILSDHPATDSPVEPRLADAMTACDIDLRSARRQRVHKGEERSEVRAREDNAASLGPRPLQMLQPFDLQLAVQPGPPLQLGAYGFVDDSAPSGTVVHGPSEQRLEVALGGLLTPAQKPRLRPAAQGSQPQCDRSGEQAMDGRSPVEADQNALVGRLEQVGQGPLDLGQGIVGMHAGTTLERSRHSFREQRRL